ncbi:MAG: ATP synthase F1 subunit gamma [Deltaproteobacteria bacterium]|nr:ATP synthase F1 subunit gamma [Deltaproteobacteria bacterium]
MPSLRSIKRRIASIINTRQITRAMKMVAAAKFKRAQESLLRIRPYAISTYDILDDLASRIDITSHPLLSRREPKRVELVIMTSDRGFCGAFNSNIIRYAENFIKENAGKYESITFSCIGKKGRDYFRRKNYNLRREFVKVFDNVNFEIALDISNDLIDNFLSANLDEIILIYNEFKSVIQQRVTSLTLLPIIPKPRAEKVYLVDYIYEPSKEEVLNDLIPRCLAIEVYRALIESAASEFGARMTAMENATNSASEMIDILTLKYNRARQAAITKELSEIITGAEAVKK